MAVIQIEGRIEILDSGKWSTVCGIGWDKPDADVACRQLGYPGAKLARPGGYYGRGTGQILLSNLECNASSLDLRFCKNTFLPGSECSHDNDVGAECILQVLPLRLTDVTSAVEGTVSLQVKTTYGLYEWVSLCANNWNVDYANVVCRELGYPSAAKALMRSSGWQSSISDFMCTGNETKISMCRPPVSFDLKECGDSNRAGVACQVSTDSRPVRLMNGKNHYEGRVEIFHAGEWTTICDTYSTWGKFEAGIVCHQLGYKGAIRALPGGSFGAGSGTILLSEVSCSKYMDDHQYDIRFCENKWYPGPAECTHANDVGVECDTGALPESVISGVVVSCVIFVVMILATVILILRCKKPTTDPSTGENNETQSPNTTPNPTPMVHVTEHIGSFRTPQLMFMPRTIVYTRQDGSSEGQHHATTNHDPPCDERTLSNNQPQEKSLDDEEDASVDVISESVNVEIDDKENLV